ncbi:alpha/beta hydrolase [Flavimarina sp. Hel_I_48]|uniref:alpha/beta hydrolase n=1 Tax=Flavimarina sp. Hel_I_48 TaxID=1392488 RepID=UPI0004DF5319|nr:esterase [Flavimarina sp. Hel_I_48]
MSMEKQVNYTAANTYSTLNTFTEETRNIWLVCHGIGYLSEYFINYFDHLDPKTNYIVAPQAPAKYYQDKSYKYIGASWFTRKYLEQETQNVVHYLDAVYDAEIKPKLDGQANLILFGYSQGVSAILRWAATSKIDCSSLLLHSGGIPEEIPSHSFDHLSTRRIVITYGNADQYFTEKRMQGEFSKAEKIFGKNLLIKQFQGIHEINRAFIQKASAFNNY